MSTVDIAYKMEALEAENSKPPKQPSRLSLFRRRRPLLFWSYITLILIIMIVPAVVLGVIFGVVKKSQAQDIPLAVDLGYSTYQGASLGNGISQWLGIRYAAAPVGDLRFRVPEDPRANSTLQIADTVC